MPVEQGPTEPEIALVIKIWNTAGGLEWAALPTLVDLYGIADVERLVVQLVTVRDWLKDNPEE